MERSPVTEALRGKPTFVSWKLCWSVLLLILVPITLLATAAWRTAACACTWHVPCSIR